MATLIQSLEYILDSKDPSLSNETKRVILKEALQAFVLDYMYNHPAYRKLNFYGGTCLHMVYGLNRLSEDLDLDNGDGVDLTDLKDDLVVYFQKTIEYRDTTAAAQKGASGVMRITLKFPLLNALGISASPNEALHLKVEISHHKQVAIIKHTPVVFQGRSFVPAHFSLETMMAGKMLACLERNFQRGREGVLIKGRDFYDLLWFMQQKVVPLEEKLAKDGKQSYTVKTAMLALGKKAVSIRTKDLSADLLPLFESRVFVEAWIEAFHANFAEYLKAYLSSEN
jgi:predicted nucleotidyltransferase component of viral defense system